MRIENIVLTFFLFFEAKPFFHSSTHSSAKQKRAVSKSGMQKFRKALIKPVNQKAVSITSQAKKLMSKFCGIPS